MDWGRGLIRKLHAAVAPNASMPFISPFVKGWRGYTKPLIHLHHDLAVSWSPKAGCTPTVIWFFQQNDLLKAALAHHAFAHRYRTEIHMRSPEYRARNKELMRRRGKGFTLLRVVRDPDKRLVSSFRHMVNQPFMDAFAQKKLGINPRETGLSLRDLAKILDGEDMGGAGRVDIHFRPQKHPVWDYDFDRVITLNMDRMDLNGGLSAVEAELGLPQTDFAQLARALKHDARRYARETPYEGEVPIEDFRFRKMRDGSFPKAEFLALPLLQQLARTCYADDFAEVVPGDSAGRLFR